jgi:hypothetical protein
LGCRYRLSLSASFSWGQLTADDLKGADGSIELTAGYGPTNDALARMNSIRGDDALTGADYDIDLPNQLAGVVVGLHAFAM